jgi:hypothetical protein
LFLDLKSMKTCTRSLGIFRLEIQSAFSLAVLALGSALLLSVSASATSLVQLSLQQLTQAASNVLQGHVVSQVSEWNASHTEIVTLTTIAVDANTKGNTPSTVVVEQPGGTIGHFRVYVPGTVHFFPQSRYVLFLEHAPATPAHYHVVGMMQGAYRIYRDQRTGQERVITPMGRFFYGQPSAGGHVNTQPETMPLQEFQQKVSRAVARPIVIPSGTALPLMIRSVSFDGVGRIELEAETTQDVYPNAQTVIPAGSLVDGWGSKSAGQWTLHWTAVSIRGREASITATRKVSSEIPSQGERMTVMTR